MAFDSLCRLPVLALALVLPATAAAQSAPHDPITAGEIQAHVDYLASDLLEGRSAGTRGAELAAAFLASQFQAAGLAKLGDGWQTRFDLGSALPDSAAIAVGGSWLEGPSLVRAARCSALGDVGGVAVVEDGDLEGNLVLVDGWPGRREARDRANELARGGAAGVCFLCAEPWIGDAERGTPAKPEAKPDKDSGISSLEDLPEGIREQIREKLESMGIDPDAIGGQIKISTGAGDGEFPSMPSDLFGGGSSLEIPVLRVNRSVGKALLAAAESGEELQLRVRSKRKPWSTNVLGVLEGSDPELASEYIVIGGHYDHLGHDGKGRIWNGADDNASGIAAILEIAEAFASLRERPRRSIVFAAWGAEERGLVGSTAFARQPPIPLENVAAYINLDMIARNDPESIGVLHASEDLLRIAEEAAVRVGLSTVAQPAFFLSASDTGPFVRNEVPVLSFFSGMHRDYHQPSDDPDTIDADKAAKTARIAFLTALEVANAEARPGFKQQRAEGMFPLDPDAPGAGVADDGLAGRIQELLGEGKSAAEIQEIIKKEFGVDVEIRIGGGQ